MILSIRVHIHQANMGSQFNSLDADRYIDWLEPRLILEFPGTKVMVNYGLSGDVIQADTADEVRDVEYTVHLLWNEFQREHQAKALQCHSKSVR